MIQDIAPHKLYNQFDPKAMPMSKSPVLHFHGGNILAKKIDGKLVFATAEEMEDDDNLQFVFRVDDELYFLAKEEPKKLPEGYEYYDLRVLRDELSLSPVQAFAAYTGKHLADWYRDFCYCGRCGTLMEHSKTERAKVCPKCGYTAYPRIMPAVIVGVKNGNKLLLTRYRQGFAHNALIAGFTEIGETLEETVAREVMEEAGVKVKNIRYYKSQPWGIANDILTGFYCEVDGNDEIHMDEGELSRAAWIERDDIELQPGSYSLTNEMMKRFKDGIEK